MRGLGALIATGIGGGVVDFLVERQPESLMVVGVGAASLLAWRIVMLRKRNEKGDQPTTVPTT